MKIVARKTATIKDDPVFLERTVWQRTSEAAAHEALHRDWGCKFYSLHRSGRINNDQREAGDRYIALILDTRKLWRDRMGDIEVYRGFGRIDAREDREPEKRSRATRDVEFAMGHVLADDLKEESEFEIKRAKRLNKRYKEARSLVGRYNTILEDLLIDNVWFAGEVEYREICNALTRLSHFFNTGKNKRSTK
jgi:hypothetical protein